MKVLVSQLFVQKLLNIAVLLFVLGAFFCIGIESSLAAQLVVSPSTGSYADGQTFTVQIGVNPEGTSVNAAQSDIAFDNSTLSVVSVSKTSAFGIWTTEPTFSNAAGTISFGGGGIQPHSTPFDILTVTFRTKGTGSASVSFTSGIITAADGKGTDVYSGSVDASYTITAGSEEPTPPPTTPTETPSGDTEDSSDAAITFGDPPRAPQVGSQVFLDPNKWYSETEGVFVWELPFDVTAMMLDLATSSEAEPTTVYDPPVEQFSIKGDMLHDGVQYLTVQFENQVGWGAILHRKIKIDSQPPEPFVINVNPGNSTSSFPLLTFKAEDTTSGVDRYEMTIAGGEPIEVTPDEAKLGYLLGKLEDGTYTVAVTAYDFAGNSTVATVPVLITAGWLPPQENVNESSFWDLFTGKNLVIILLSLLVILLLVFGYLARRKNRAREERLRRETKEIQDQMEKIFSALRDEIYEQINQITKRTKLSKKEKESVENLHQALEVSETLIEKEVGDVKEILK